MPNQKKRQHYVPQVYLQPFSDRTPPKGFNPSRPYKPTVWVIDALTMGSPHRKAPSNILWSNKIYTLDSDDPSTPVVEESLSRLESSYRRVRDHILGLNQLTFAEYAALLFFIGALKGRTPPEIRSFQNLMDTLGSMSKKLSELPPEGMAWSDFVQSGVKAIAARASGYASVVGPHGFILVNHTDLNLITSDSPVTHQILHVDDAPVKFFGPNLKVGIPASTRAFFSFVPISPDRAFISSPFLCSGGELYVSTCSKELIFSLNQCARSAADSMIISKVPNPYGQVTQALIDKEAEIAATSTPRSGLMVYTPSARVWIETQEFSHEDGINPLHSVIRFVSLSIDELKNVAGVEDINEVLIYSNGRLAGSMMDCWLAAVALSNEGESIIESFPGGWKVWRD